MCEFLRAMATTKKALYSACLVFLGVNAAHADGTPKTLHMRKTRVAQTPPPDNGGTPTPPPENGGAPPPADTGAPAPAPAPAPTPPPADQPPAGGMTDEELAKMAAQDSEKTQGEEVITVTG